MEVTCLNFAGLEVRTEGPWNVCLAGTWESGDLEEMETLRGEGKIPGGRQNRPRCTFTEWFFKWSLLKAASRLEVHTQAHGQIVQFYQNLVLQVP